MKVEIEDYELSNMREYIKRSQQTLALCTGINQAILELCNANAAKLGSLGWSIEQQQSLYGTWSAALQHMRDQEGSIGSTDSHTGINPSPILSTGTPEKLLSGKQRRRGHPPAKKSKTQTQAVATAVPTKAKSRRRSSLAGVTRKYRTKEQIVQQALAKAGRKKRNA